MSRTFFLISFLSIFFFVSCNTVPVTSRRQLLLSSEEYENSLGATAYVEFKKEYPASSNAIYNSALQRVGAAISKVANKDSFEWEFVVLDSEEANAFCLPGGKVAVYSGIFKFVENEAELATIVSHEVAHALARHGGERISWAQVKAVGALGLQKAGVGTAWEALYGVGTEVGVMLPFSRKHEYEADSIGLILMARAGYQPQAAVHFWEKFSAGRNPGAIEQWLSTHPAGKDRVNNLQQLMPQAMQEYEKAALKRGYGQKMAN